MQTGVQRNIKKDAQRWKERERKNTETDRLRENDRNGRTHTVNYSLLSHFFSQGQNILTLLSACFIHTQLTNVPLSNYRMSRCYYFLYSIYFISQTHHLKYDVFFSPWQLMITFLSCKLLMVPSFSHTRPFHFSRYPILLPHLFQSSPYFSSFLNIQASSPLPIHLFYMHSNPF